MPWAKAHVLPCLNNPIQIGPANWRYFDDENKPSRGGCAESREAEANSGGAVSRVLSAPPRGGGEAHFSERPYPGSAPRWRRAARATLWIPYLALHPMGFSVPRRLRAGRWALTPPFHPCRPPRRTAGGLFSVALSVGRASRPGPPRVFPGRSPGLRGIAPCGARTFLPRRAGSEPPPLRSSWKRYRRAAAKQGRGGLAHPGGAGSLRPASARLAGPSAVPAPAWRGEQGKVGDRTGKTRGVRIAFAG